MFALQLPDGVFQFDVANCLMPCEIGSQCIKKPLDHAAATAWPLPSRMRVVGQKEKAALSIQICVGRPTDLGHHAISVRTSISSGSGNRRSSSFAACSISLCAISVWWR